MKIGELIAQLKVDDSEFASKVNTAGSRFQGLGDKVSSVGSRMTTRVSAPLAGLGGLAIKTGMDFEASMNKVAAVTGASGDEIDALSGLAREMGSTTKYSASEAADALGFLGMAGFDSAQMTEALPGVLNLATAGSLELADAADIASNVLSGYGMDVSDLSRVNDVLASTASSSNTSVQMLGETMKYAAPVANAAGLEFEETAAMAGLMGNAGIQASQAGTALRGGISRLLNPTKQVSSALEGLGVSVTDSNGQLRPMADIMGDLESAGASTSDMIQIFGQEAGPAFMAVLSQGNDELRKFTGELRNSDGAAAQMAETMGSGAKGSFASLKSAAEELLLTISDAGLLTGFQAIVEGLTSIVRGAGQVSPAVTQVAVVLGVLLAAVGPLLFIGGKFISVYGRGMVMGLNLARGAVNLLSGSAIRGAATQTAAWARSAAASVAAGAKMTASGAAAAGRATAHAATVAAAWTRKGAAATRSGIRQAAAWTMSTGAAAARGVASMVAAAGRVAAQWVRMAVTAMARAAVMAASWIVAMGPIGWVTAAVVGLVVLIIANWDKVKERTVAAWSAVTSFISDAWSNIVSTVSSWIARAIAFVLNGWNRAKSVTSSAWSSLVSTIASFIAKAISWVAGIPGRVLSALGNLGGLLLNSGRALVDGFLSGIKGTWSKITGFVKDGMQKLRNLWPFSPAKEGPFAGSGYVTHSGKALTSDFAGSLRKGMPGVIASARQIADATRGELNVDAGPRFTASRAAGMPGDAWLSRDQRAGRRRDDQQLDADALLDAVRAGVRDGMNGARLGVDARGFARVVNRQNAADRRLGGTRNPYTGAGRR